MEGDFMRKKNSPALSIIRAALYIREKYGVNWCDATFRRMLHEKLYTGVYDRSGRRNDNFCQPIISNEQFDRVQTLLNRNARSSPSGRVYIFTSVLKQVREDYVEEWLFAHLAEELERCRLDLEVKAAKKKKRAMSSTDKAAIKHKLQKLKELYVNDLIDLEEYKKDYQIYTSALNQLPEAVDEKPPDFSAIEALLQNNFKQIYETLTREEKRTLWRSIIKEIRIDSENNITGISFG